MPLFRRRPAYRIPPQSSWPVAEPPVLYAVPIAAAEAVVLVAGLRTHDQLQRDRAWTPLGPTHAAGMADRILRDAGTAAAYGEPAIPFLVEDLLSLRYTLVALQEDQPHRVSTHDFMRLHDMLHARSGMAKLRQWRVTWSEQAGTLWWEGPPPQPATAPEGISE